MDDVLLRLEIDEVMVVEMLDLPFVKPALPLRRLDRVEQRVTEILIKGPGQADADHLAPGKDKGRHGVDPDMGMGGGDSDHSQERAEQQEA